MSGTHFCNDLQKCISFYFVRLYKVTDVKIHLISKCTFAVSSLNTRCVKLPPKYLHIPKGPRLHLPETQLVTQPPSQTGDINKNYFLLNIVLSISNFTFFKAYRLHLRFMKKNHPSTPIKKTLRGYGTKK